jgi:hypothetical protein
MFDSKAHRGHRTLCLLRSSQQRTLGPQVHKTITLILVFTLFSVGAAAPQADDLKNNLANPEVLISAIAPDKVRSASPSASITVSEPQNQPLLRSSVAERIDVNISDPETKVDVTLGIRDELAFSGLSAGYQVFINENETSAAYLKATPNGGQVIFAGANKQAVDDMRRRLSEDLCACRSRGGRDVGHSLSGFGGPCVGLCIQIRRRTTNT